MSVKQTTFNVVIVIGLSAVVANAGAAVSASSVHSSPFLPRYAVDGNPKTRWASRSFTGKAEWLQIDFGKPTPVNNLAIHWERAYAAEYQIQVSDDGKTWKTVHHKKDGRGNKEVFADSNDPDYKKLVEMAAAGKKHLEKIKRFDMRGFRPRLEYVREMKRFGILPADLPLDAPVDVYKTDQAYWRSLWYRAPASGKSPAR